MSRDAVVATSGSAQATSSERARVIGAVCAMISVAAPPFLVAVLAVQIERQLGFSTTALGVGIGGYFLVSAVMSPVMGRAVSRWGAGRLLRLACALATLGLLIIAAAPNAATIVLVLALLGVPNSAAQPAATQVITGVRGNRAQAFSFGLVQASVPATTLLAGLVLAALHGASWRVAVTAVGCATVLAQVAVRGVPLTDGHRWPTRGPADALSSKGAGVPSGRARRFIVLMAVGGFFLSFAAQCLPAFLVVTGTRTGMQPASVATVQIAASLASIVARIAVAARAGRSAGADDVRSLGLLALAGTIGFALLGVGDATAFLAGALVAYGCGWGWSALFNFSVARARPDSAAASAGVTQAGVFFGGSTGPVVFAFIVTTSNVQVAWCSAAMSSTLAACCLFAARRQWR